MKSIRLLGHRGYSAKFTENTIDSFKEAIQCGADGVEFDIQRTRDGKFIIFHDLNLQRLTGINANVNTVDYAELKRLNIEGGLKIPLLEELLAIVPENFILNIELKQSIEQHDLEDIYSIICSTVTRDNVLISSFHHDLLPFFKERGIQTGMLVGHEEHKEGLWSILYSLVSLRPAYLNPPVKGFFHINRFSYYSFLFTVKLLGIKLAFYTVNSEKEFSLISGIADIVITDNIEEIETLIDKREMKKGISMQHRWNTLAG